MGKRSTDEAGPTPGERVGRWLSNIKIVIALWLSLGGALAYGTNDSVRNWIHGADDIVPSEEGFNQQVIYAIEEINKKLTEQETKIKNLKSRDYTDQEKIQKQIDKINELVN